MVTAGKSCDIFHREGREKRKNLMPYLKENILCPELQSLHCYLWSFRHYKHRTGQTAWNSVMLWWRVISALLKGYDSLLQGKGRKQLNKWGIWLVKEIVETYLSWPEPKNKLFSDCKAIKAAKAVLIRKYPENPGNPGAVFIAKCPHSWPLSFGGPEKRMGLLLGYSSPANTGVTEVWHNLHADSEQQLRSTQNSAEQW